MALCDLLLGFANSRSSWQFIDYAIRCATRKRLLYSATRHYIPDNMIWSKWDGLWFGKDQLERIADSSG